MFILNSEGNLVEFDNFGITKVSDKIFNKIVCGIVSDGDYTFDPHNGDIIHSFNIFASKGSCCQNLGAIETMIISYSNSMFLCFDSESLDLMRKHWSVDMSNFLIEITHNLFGIEIDDHLWSDSDSIKFDFIWPESDFIYVLYTDPFKNLICYKLGKEANKIILPLCNVNDFDINGDDLIYCNDKGLFQIDDIYNSLVNNSFKSSTKLHDHSNIIKFMEFHRGKIFIDNKMNFYMLEGNKLCNFESFPKILDFEYNRDINGETFAFLSEDGYIHIKDVSMNVLTPPLYQTENFNNFLTECQKIYVGPGATFSTFPKKMSVKNARKCF